MEKEEIYINLRVIQGLDKNQKLISRGSYLNVEPNSIVPEFLRRWHRQDNRNECLKKIGLVVNSAIEYILKLIDANKSNSEGTTNILIVDDKNNCNKNTVNNEISTMKKYLEDSLKGIKNLKETYATDTQTCARIDVIINKITQILED